MKTNLISLLDNAKLNKKENDLYLRGLRNHKEEHIFTEIKKIHQEVFTKIDCIECANCCKTIQMCIRDSHKSMTNETPGKPTNERLEYLGDAILSTIVAEYLFKKYPNKDCLLYTSRCV